MSLKDKLQSLKPTTLEKVEESFSGVYGGSEGVDAKRIEALAHNELKKKYKSPEEKFDGSFETFVGANIDDTVNFIKNILDGSPNINPLRHTAE